MDMEFVLGDITQQDTDAIVNAANRTLGGGGGVDGAIHRAAGPDLLAACLALPQVAPGVRCPTGEARITPGYRLRTRFVIHAVGPVWGQQDDAASDTLLVTAHLSALRLAEENQVETVAFPAISCGAFYFPTSRAGSLVRAALSGLHPRSVRLVRFVFLDDRTRRAFSGQTR